VEVPIALGVIFYIIGLVTLLRKVRFLREAITTKGLIARLETVYESLPAGPTGMIGVKKDVPVVWFKTSIGTNIVAKLPSTDLGKYDLKQDVLILYDPRNPQQVAIPGFNYWYAPALFLLWGTLSFLGLLVFR
jgi:hypothetical protein